MLIRVLEIAFVFGLLVMFHEFGHYALARLNGIKVLEFSFGFGPKLVGYKSKDTLYAIRLVPLGGFVKLYGMDEELNEKGEPVLVAINDPQSYTSKKVWQRASVIAAGPIMNFVLAILLFVIIYTAMGIPTAGTSNVVGSVVSGDPAASVGIKEGDKITAINGKATPDWDSLTDAIWVNPNKQIQVTVERDSQQKTYALTPQLDKSTGHGIIGISQEVIFEKASFSRSIGYGLERTVDLTKYIVVTIGQMITGKTQAEVGGPVMIAQAIGQAAAQGWADLFSLAGALSVQLGLLNLFPIPALDGSKLVFLGVEGIRGKAINPEKENFVHFIGFVLLMALMVAVTYKDIVGLIK